MNCVIQKIPGPERVNRFGQGIWPQIPKHQQNMFLYGAMLRFLSSGNLLKSFSGKWFRQKWMYFPADKSFSKIMIFSTTNWCGLRPKVNFNRSTVHETLFVGIILAINPVRYYLFRMFNNRKSWIHVFLCLETFLFSLFQKQVSALLIGQEWNQFLFFSLGQKIVTLRNKMTQDWWLIHLFDGETEKPTIGEKTKVRFEWKILCRGQQVK